MPLEWELAVTGNSASYVEVTDIVSYEIGITPDLGWATHEAMFLPYSPMNPEGTNAKLFTAGDLSVDDGTLTYDEEERDVYVDLTENQMQAFLGFGYPDYLWAVRGKSRRGAVSRWSDVRKFQGVYEAPDAWFTVEPPASPARERTITLYGDKDPSIAKMEIGGNTGLARYPSSDSWAYDTVLEPGKNVFEIRGHPTYGRATTYRKVEVELFTGKVDRQLVPNTFDHFGALHGVDRLSVLNETNDNYKTRIKDVFIHPAGSNREGLHNSIARQLDLTYDDYCIVIRPALIETGRRATDMYPMSLEIATNNIFLDSPHFLVPNEHHVVEPQGLTVTLQFDMSGGSGDLENVLVYTSPGVEAPRQDYDIDFSERKITFKKDSYQYKRVWVTYARKLSTPIGTDVDLDTVVAALEALQFDGRQLLTATLSSLRAGTEDSDGLLRGVYGIRGPDRYVDANGDTQSGRSLRWTNTSMHHLLDTGYWSRHLNEDGHVLNTKIEAYVDSFKMKAHHTWEQAVCDKDIWDPVDEETEHSNHLWRLWDSIRGYWRSSNVNVTARYTTTQAFDRGFEVEEDKAIMMYYGVPKNEFKSGIGRDQDLKVVITKPTVIEELTEPGVFRATVNWSITGQVAESTYLPPTQWGSLFFSP